MPNKLDNPTAVDSLWGLKDALAAEGRYIIPHNKEQHMTNNTNTQLQTLGHDGDGWDQELFGQLIDQIGMLNRLAKELEHGRRGSFLKESYCTSDNTEWAVGDVLDAVGHMTHDLECVKAQVETCLEREECEGPGWRSPIRRESARMQAAKQAQKVAAAECNRLQDVETLLKEQLLRNSVDATLASKIEFSCREEIRAARLEEAL